MGRHGEKETGKREKGAVPSTSENGFENGIWGNGSWIACGVVVWINKMGGLEIVSCSNVTC